MKLTFIKLSTGTKECRDIDFIDIKEDSINTDKGLFYFIDQKDMRFKSCKLDKIVRNETDFPVIQMLKDKEV